MIRTAIVLALALNFVATVDAQPRVTVDELKAAFLYKFGNFVEWPNEAFVDEDDPFTVGVMGAERIAGHLKAIAVDKTMFGRAIEIREVRPGDSLEGIHMLFVGNDAAARFQRSFEGIENLAILVVTDSGNLPVGAWMINFVVVDARVRFDVAPESAQSRGVRISSRLLSVARHVVMVDP